MSTDTRTAAVDLASSRRPGLAPLALVLAVVSLPASLLGWDLFEWGGIVIGVPLAFAALLTGLAARRRPGSGGRPVATAAVVLAIGVILIPVVWTIAGVAAG